MRSPVATIAAALSLTLGAHASRAEEPPVLEAERWRAEGR